MAIGALRCWVAEVVRVVVILAIVVLKAKVAPRVLRSLPEPLLHQALFMTRGIVF